MKYGFVIKTQSVPEWKEAYINYKILKKILKPYKVMSKIYLKVLYPDHIGGVFSLSGQSSVTITNASKGELEKLNYFGSKFSETVRQEHEKMNIFFRCKYEENKQLWNRFKINVAILQNIQHDSKYDLHKIQLKNCFHFFYKELSLLIEYVNVNQEALRKIVKKYKKFSKNFSQDHKNLKSLVSNSKSFVDGNLHKLMTFRSEVENVYINTFYRKFNRKDGQNELRKISHGKLITQRQSFLFGFFLGFTFFVLVLVVFMFYYTNLELENLLIFPIMRGMGLILVYFWALASNVYVWMEYNINYRLIFQFNFHFSDISDILKRVSLFTVVYLFSCLFFLGLEMESQKILDFIPINLMNLIPLIPYIVFFGYLLFPSKVYFNPIGRLYVFEIIYEILGGIWRSPTFKLLWSIDQITSFGILLRDFQYLICFYLFGLHEIIHIGLFNIDFLIVTIFMCIQIVLLMKNICKTKELSNFTNFLNGLKYFTLILVMLVDLLSISNIEEFEWWPLYAIFCVIYFIIWDAKFDWGLLKPNCKYKYLRKELSFDSKFFYYFSIIINIFLRISWIFTLCPNILKKLGFSQQTIMWIGFFEMIRRCIWNFLIVEKEHIMNCGIFKKTEEIELPFEHITFKQKEEEDQNYSPTATINFEVKSELETPILSDFSEIKEKKQSLKGKFEKCKSLVEMEKELKKTVNLASKQDHENLLSEINEFCIFLKKTMDMKFKVVDEEIGITEKKNKSRNNLKVNFFSD